jgi:hypothetical protein
VLGKRLRCLTNGGLLGGQRGVAEARKCQEQHRARKKQAGAAKEGYIVALSYVVEYCEGPGPGDRTYQNERVSTSGRSALPSVVTEGSGDLFAARSAQDLCAKSNYRCRERSCSPAPNSKSIFSCLQGT